MTAFTAKRFYEEVSVRREGDGFVIALDERIAKTPGGHPLTVPYHGLADAIAGEWAAQEEEIRPPEMPLTQLVATAMDRVARERAAVIEGIVAYVGTDLLCYRADLPSELRQRQDTSWQPLLDWSAEILGAQLAVTTGIVAVDQLPDAFAGVRRTVETFDDLSLAALVSATGACGSVILALALATGWIDAAAAFGLSHVDEIYQIERWGEDEEAKARLGRVRAEIEATAIVLGFRTADGA